MTLDPIEQQKHTNTLAVEDRKEQGNERLERLKHTLALERESLARVERVREVQFLEAGQHMRALNAFMWQVPSIAIAVTGGLWYGTSTVADDSAKAAVLAFAAVIDALFIIVLWRVRFLFQQNLATQLSYTQSQRSSGISGYVVVTVWSALLLLASILSAIAAYSPERVAQRSSGITRKEGSQVTSPPSTQTPQQSRPPSSASATESAAAAKPK